MPIKQIDGYKIYLDNKLGEGSYGAVYIGMSDDTHEKVAVKILKKSSSNYIFIPSRFRWLPQKCLVFRNQDHAKREIRKYCRVLRCDGEFKQLLYCTGALRWRFIFNHEKRAASPLALGKIVSTPNNQWLFVTSEGGHHPQVLFFDKSRDLKPANIMRKGNKLKIGDFGFAKKS